MRISDWSSDVCSSDLDPCDFFVSRYYLEQAKYLDGFSLRKLPRSKQSTLLWHYLTVGLPQGKEPIEFFDSQYYLAQYSEVERHVRTGAITTPLAPFMNYGASANRRPGPELDPATLSHIDRMSTRLNYSYQWATRLQ